MRVQGHHGASEESTRARVGSYRSRATAFVRAWRGVTGQVIRWLLARPPKIHVGDRKSAKGSAGHLPQHAFLRENTANAGGVVVRFQGNFRTSF